MQGRCLCGDIRFEIRDPFSKIYQCHCSLCRKQGGSASNAALIVKGDQFRWISGQSQISSFVKPTGFRSDFCARCGSPVPNPLRATPYYWIPAGLLEDGPGLEVAVHIMVGSKAPWDRVDPSVPQHDAIPELSEFIALLHGGR